MLHKIMIIEELYYKPINARMDLEKERGKSNPPS